MYTGINGYLPVSSEDDPIAKAAYDEIADTYAEDVRTNAYNAEL